MSRWPTWDACHAAAQLQGYSIVYPLTDEPWGVRRFMSRDPNGVIVNVVSHEAEPARPRERPCSRRTPGTYAAAGGPITRGRRLGLRR